jgi:hypothetical protein
VNWCAFNMASTRFEEKPDHFPQEMLLDLSRLLIESMPDTVKEKVNEERNIASSEVEEPR